jgi:hypothetical protein
MTVKNNRPWSGDENRRIWASWKRGLFFTVFSPSHTQKKKGSLPFTSQSPTSFHSHLTMSQIKESVRHFWLRQPVVRFGSASKQFLAHSKPRR